MREDKCKPGGCSSLGCEGGIYCFNADGTRKVVSETEKQELTNALRGIGVKREKITNENVGRICAQFVGQNLQQMCRELVEWSETAELPMDSKVRELASYMSEDAFTYEADALRIVRQAVEFAALQVIARSGQ